MITIEPATFAAAEHIAEHMRDADRRELRDLSNVGPFEAVLEAMQLPGEKWVGSVDGVPAAIFGVTTVSILGNVGSPWLMGTDDTDKGARLLIQRGRELVADWASRYSLLENVVDGRNWKTVKWLKRLGFTFDHPIEVKPGVPAMRFWMEAARDV